MASKKAHEAARARAAKEKKILIALVPLLLVAGWFGWHTMSKLHSSPSTTPPAATTPGATVSTGTPVSATTPVASIVTPPSDTGKLDRTPGFAPKDPFHDQGPHTTTTTAADNSATSGSNAKSKASKTPAPPPSAAVIAVNGHLASVVVGAVFPVTKNPATDGIFKLVSLTAKSAKVAVAGGSYTSGRHVLTLTVNSIVTLVNTADGKRYTLILYPPGTPAPGAPASVTTTSTRTTPTTTSGP